MPVPTLDAWSCWVSSMVPYRSASARSASMGMMLVASMSSPAAPLSPESEVFGLKAGQLGDGEPVRRMGPPTSPASQRRMRSSSHARDSLMPIGVVLIRSASSARVRRARCATLGAGR